MKTPLFTIGLMTYNNAGYVEKALNSVLAQDCQDWELIISDDNSSDNTEDIVAPYLKDERISYIKHVPNLGQADNWNYLIKSATGQYFATLHADDYWAPSYLSSCVEVIEKYNPEIIQINWNYIYEDGTEYDKGPLKKFNVLKGKDIVNDQLKRFTVLPSASVFKPQFAQSVTTPNKAYKYAVDFDYFIKLAANAKVSVQINKDLVYYRTHDSSVTSNFGKGKNWQNERKVLKENLQTYFTQLNLSKESFTYLNRKIAFWALISAQQDAAQGQVKDTLSYVREAVAVYPAVLKDISVFARIFAKMFINVFKR